MSDMDLSYEEACDFVERAGKTAAVKLLLELLKEALEANERALEANQLLEARLSALEARVVHVEANPFGPRIGGNGWQQPNTNRPVWYDDHQYNGNITVTCDTQDIQSSNKVEVTSQTFMNLVKAIDESVNQNVVQAEET